LKKFRFLILLPVFLLIVLVVGFCWWRWAVGSVDREATQAKIFVIQKGEGGKSVAYRLQQAGLINNAWAFRMLAYFQGWEDQIQAGDFRLQPAWSAVQIAETLTHGTMDIWLTFPEGWRREEYAQRLAANLAHFDKEKFLQLTKIKEGYLFPDTYLVPKDADAAWVLDIFDKNFVKKFDAGLEALTIKQGLTQKQVLVLASLVEREARNPQNRPIVAGILRKRWQADWPLQVDATLQYIKGGAADWWPQVTGTDKKLRSAYNTYQHKGLPPGPICNSGLASIEAVLKPRETDYWFYLTGLQGQMHYARTSEEHNANIAQYLRPS